MSRWRTARFVVGERHVVVLPDDGPMEKWSLRIKGSSDIRKIVDDDERFFRQKQFLTMDALGFSMDAQRTVYGRACRNADVAVVVRKGRIVRVMVNGVDAASMTLAHDDDGIGVVVWDAWEGESYETRQQRQKRAFEGSVYRE